MIITTSSGIEKQKMFFGKNHPYQPIFVADFPHGHVDRAKDMLTNIGQQTGLWTTEKKLPPIEQMARRVGLSTLYHFLYAATSEIVHFNVRIALRSGWGGKDRWRFSSSHLSTYYFMFGRCYSVYIFIKLSRTFAVNLKLSTRFMKSVDNLELWLESQFRWPEIVTFEETNQSPRENVILYAVLQVLQESRVKKLQLRHDGRRRGPRTIKPD